MTINASSLSIQGGVSVASGVSVTSFVTQEVSLQDEKAASLHSDDSSLLPWPLKPTLQGSLHPIVLGAPEYSPRSTCQDR